jgi:hypothetical protein
VSHLPDPSDRGKLLTDALTTALREADKEIEERYGVRQLATRHFLEGECIKTLAMRAMLSQRSVHYALAQALARTVERLPNLLSRIDLRPVWSPYISDEVTDCPEKGVASLSEKLAVAGNVCLIGDDEMRQKRLAAHLAGAWCYAGWNVIWTSYDDETDNPFGTLIADLHAQLAQVGAVNKTQIDSTNPPSKYITALMQEMRPYPMLFVINTVSAFVENIAWVELLDSPVRG